MLPLRFATSSWTCGVAALLVLTKFDDAALMGLSFPGNDQEPLPFPDDYS